MIGLVAAVLWMEGNHGTGIVIAVLFAIDVFALVLATADANQNGWKRSDGF